MAVDPEEGRIVIRRGLAGGPPPNVMNLISAPMNMRDVPLGVMTFAERFAAGETANDGALLDFLMRAPPRLKGVASGAALQTRERMQRRLLCAPSPLSTIAISSFKDRLAPARYTAAEAIILSLKQGYRSALHRTLTRRSACCWRKSRLASRAKYKFAGAKRGNKDDAERHFTSNNIQTVLESEQIGTSFLLVGGTVFHFCREDQRGTFDFLVVDEAGQVSLGNLTVMAACARNLVLVGDQMQLPQPVQGVHPGERGLSSLDIFFKTVRPSLPIAVFFLNQTRRLHQNSASSSSMPFTMADCRHTRPPRTASLS
jgi:uncharacterized protein